MTTCRKRSGALHVVKPLHPLEPKVGCALLCLRIDSARTSKLRRDCALSSASAGLLAVASSAKEKDSLPASRGAMTPPLPGDQFTTAPTWCVTTACAKVPTTYTHRPCEPEASIGLTTTCNHTRVVAQPDSFPTSSPATYKWPRKERQTSSTFCLVCSPEDPPGPWAAVRDGASSTSARSPRSSACIPSHTSSHSCFACAPALGKECNAALPCMLTIW